MQQVLKKVNKGLRIILISCRCVREDRTGQGAGTCGTRISLQHREQTELG